MMVAGGTRVAIRQHLLAPSERGSALPEDTARLPYEAVIRGSLVRAARLGALATVRTATGRLVKGRLEEVEPADTHGFGRPVAALTAADRAITKLVMGLRE